ncbi:MAG: chemotaxis protein CheY [Bacteroidetes bacterium]|nr:chemotaxis protein CheY [Bacteroidota bacterium]
MLVDDNPHDNFFHERAIKANDAGDIVLTKESAADALECLRSDTDPHSDLIFLDINMPGMNGWEFLRAYSELDKTVQEQNIIIMLTTSEHPEDLKKTDKWNFVSDYITKPLTKEKMKAIADKYFRE